MFEKRSFWQSNRLWRVCRRSVPSWGFKLISGDYANRGGWQPRLDVELGTRHVSVNYIRKSRWVE